MMVMMRRVSSGIVLLLRFLRLVLVLVLMLMRCLRPGAVLLFPCLHMMLMVMMRRVSSGIVLLADVTVKAGGLQVDCVYFTPSYNKEKDDHDSRSDGALPPGMPREPRCRPGLDQTHQFLVGREEQRLK
jgi:hypothetical protein